MPSVLCQSMEEIIAELNPTAYELQLWLQRRGVFCGEEIAKQTASLHMPGPFAKENMAEIIAKARMTPEGLLALGREDRSALEVRECCGAIYMHVHGRTDPAEVVPIKKELLALPWETKRTARHEYFMAHTERDYSYGNRGTGAENYSSKPFTLHVHALLNGLNEELRTELNVCFLNKYDDQHQHLGWHSDEFPGMRDDQPIVVVSFGAEREIWLKDKRGFLCPTCGGTGSVPHNNPASGYAHMHCRNAPVEAPGRAGCEGTGWLQAPPNGKQPANQRLSLAEGSVFIMPPGYQDTHLHRIPKHDRPCGWRISLTFRSFV